MQCTEGWYEVKQQKSNGRELIWEQNRWFKEEVEIVATGKLKKEEFYFFWLIYSKSKVVFHWLNFLSQ